MFATQGTKSSHKSVRKGPATSWKDEQRSGLFPGKEGQMTQTLDTESHASFRHKRSACGDSTEQPFFFFLAPSRLRWQGCEGKAFSSNYRGMNQHNFYGGQFGINIKILNSHTLWLFQIHLPMCRMICVQGYVFTAVIARDWKTPKHPQQALS